VLPAARTATCVSLAPNLTGRVIVAARPCRATGTVHSALIVGSFTEHAHGCTHAGPARRAEPGCRAVWGELTNGLLAFDPDRGFLCDFRFPLASGKCLYHFESQLAIALVEVLEVALQASPVGSVPG